MIRKAKRDRLAEWMADTPLGKRIVGAEMGVEISADAQAIVFQDGVDVPAGGDAAGALTVDWFYGTCRSGQGPATCRYLARGMAGIACGKVVPEIRAEIDRRRRTMKARGDNCQGRTGFIPGSTPIDRPRR